MKLTPVAFSKKVPEYCVIGKGYFKRRLSMFGTVYFFSGKKNEQYIINAPLVIA